MVKRDVKKLFVRSIIFLTILFILDFVIGEAIRHIYFTSKNKYTYGITEAKPDILVVGSSRALHHYVPYILNDSLGLSCFNMGSGGQNIFFYYGIVGSVLERHKPEIIIWDVMEGDVVRKEGDDNKFSELLPLYRSSGSIRTLIRLVEPSERFKMISRIYPFNSKVPSMVYSFAKRNNNPHFLMDGYIPLEGKLSQPPFEGRRDKTFVVDSLKLGFITDIASKCMENNIKLVAIVSPRFTRFAEESPSLKIVADILSVYGFEVWDYEQDQRFSGSGDLFMDELHLNNSGAIEYTKIIAERIRKEFPHSDTEFHSLSF